MNDLISRSALLEAMDKLYMAALRKTAHSVETIYELDHLSMLVKDAPAVDAEPVRHGYWKDKGNHLECSECGHEFTKYDWEGSIVSYYWCPCCGAKTHAEVHDDA